MAEGGRSGEIREGEFVAKILNYVCQEERAFSCRYEVEPTWSCTQWNVEGIEWEPKWMSQANASLERSDAPSDEGVSGCQARASTVAARGRRMCGKCTALSVLRRDGNSLASKVHLYGVYTRRRLHSTSKEKGRDAR